MSTTDTAADQVSEWIPMSQQPAVVGWYDVLEKGGTVRRYWRGHIWWAMMDPSCGFDTNLIFDPGTHWRGLASPPPGLRAERTAHAKEVAYARRIVFTGKA